MKTNKDYYTIITRSNPVVASGKKKCIEALLFLRAVSRPVNLSMCPKMYTTVIGYII